MANSTCLRLFGYKWLLRFNGLEVPLKFCDFTIPLYKPGQLTFSSKEVLESCVAESYNIWEVFKLWGGGKATLYISHAFLERSKYEYGGVFVILRRCSLFFLLFPFIRQYFSRTFHVPGILYVWGVGNKEEVVWFWEYCALWYVQWECPAHPSLPGTFPI